MPLHPRIVAALQAAERLPPYDSLPVPEARAFVKLGYPPREPPLQVAAVDNRTIDGPRGPIPVRIYWPEAPGLPQPLPLLVFFHGSGFVLLDLDSHDDLCRRLCRGARCIVVSVDYRLAPEHKFPAGPDDCLAATRWAALHANELGADRSRIAVAGDSAGGCLAAVTALRVLDQGGPKLCGQLHFYPVTDYYDPPTDSYGRFAHGHGLTARGMRWFWDHYLADGTDVNDASVAPLRAASLAGLPPACILTAEYDVLRDEGEAYAQRLRDHGTPVMSRRCASLNHGFLRWGDEIDEVAEAIAFSCRWLLGAFG